MPKVFLKAIGDSGFFGSSKYTIEQQQYEHCYIFKRYELKLIDQSIAEDIYVHKNQDNSSNSLTLIRGSKYNSAILEKVHVYYSKYDDKHAYPLLLVLFFKDAKFTNRYYRLSLFDDDIRQKKTKEIDHLTKYDDEKTVLNHLVDEHDRVDGISTYLVDRTIELHYNLGKIYINKVDVRGSSDQPNAFTSYMHTSTVLSCKSKACVLYKQQVLLWLNNDKPVRRMVPIEQIQNVNICSMTVYFNPKNNKPLIVEFDIENKGKRQTSYYFQKTSSLGFFWQILDESSSKYLLGTSLRLNQIHSKLTSGSNKLLLQALNKIDECLVKVLIVFVDKIDDYMGKEVKETLQRVGLNTDSYILANSDGKIKVKDISSDTCKRLSEKGYSVYEHDFNEISKNFKSDDTVRIKFIKFNHKFIFEDNSTVLINLDYQFESAHYTSVQREIQVSKSYNPKHNYVWYRHSSFKKIIEGTFKLYFNDQSLTINGNLGDLSYNTAVIVYFYSDYRDRFVLVAFPDKKFTKVWYMTYFDFIKSVLGRKTIQLSQLKTIFGDVNTNYETGGVGIKIDRPILQELEIVYEQLKSDAEGSMDSLLYQKDKDKLYVYSSISDSRTLMICYNDRAYRRYFLGTKSSKWKPVDGTTECICTGQVESFVQKLEGLGDLHSLTDSQGSLDQDESEDPVTIDISINTKPIYDKGRVVVSDKKVYDESNLFIFYTHTFKDNSQLKISSLSASTSNKSINLDEVTVKSIDVYFNMFITDKPLILCIKSDNGEPKYYKNLIQDSEKYQISEDKNISSRLCDQLFEENEKSNNSCIYHIDKTDVATNTYGFSSRIKLSEVYNKTNKFIKYTHNPTKSLNNKAFILYKKQLLVGKSSSGLGHLDSIQNKLYNEIIVYILDRDRDLPLLIELKGSKSSSTCYSCKTHESKLYWENEAPESSSDLKIKNKLNELYYYLKSSAIIEIDKGGGPSGQSLNYELRIIENRLNDQNLYEKSNYIDGKGLQPKKNIAPEAYKVHHGMDFTQYKIISHDISDAADLSSGSNTNLVIAGMRLFVRNSIGETLTELQLYPSDRDANQPKKRLLLYYPPLGNFKKLYVYFHGEDPRPLALCYDGQMYKRLDTNNNVTWIYTKSARCSESSEVLHTLKIIYKSMEAKVTFVKDKGQTNITANTKKLIHFTRESYKPEFRRQIQSKLSKYKLTEHINDKSIIDKLLDSLLDRTFDFINVYYKVKSKPLFFEFIDGSSRTHFQRRDAKSKYWVKDNIEYERDNDLDAQLVKIETSVDETIVYEIDKKTDSYNSYISLGRSYNKPSSGYNIYTHTPKGGYTSRKSLVLYNLMKLTKKYSNLIPEIQDQKYSKVTVYCGSRVNGNTDFPLIVEFTKTDPVSKSYYSHKLYNSSFYWENITIPSEGSENKQLITKLKETELGIVESVVFLVDKTTGTYGISQMSKAVRDISPKEINLASIGAYSISISNLTDSGAKVVSEHGYMLYEHNLGSYLTGDKHCALRFFILTSVSAEKYTEISLYNSSGDFETLYYEKNGGNDKDKVYLYFYSKDPRPLLACYSGSAYKPKSSESYFEKWYKDSTINKCKCENNEDNPNLISALSEVVKILNVVQLEEKPYISDPKNEEPVNKGKTDHTYSVQKFKAKDINIKVTYENKKCYRVYTHKPDGMVNNGDGFRLGNIEYNATPTSINYESHKPLSAVSVFYSVYDQKHEHPFLVSLEFKSNGGDTCNEYYKLREKGGKEWVKISDSDSIIDKLKDYEKIEEGLYDLRKELDIKFENKDNSTALFKIKKCDEDKPVNIPVVVGSSVGTAAVVGTGVTIGIVVAKKLAAAAFVAAVT